MKSRNMDKFVVRLPDGLRAWIASEASANASSMNSEIVRCIRERMVRIASLHQQEPTP